MNAPPDIKIIMDNQLKNVKTYSRLLSKGMWYEWRMTLLATLKDGFFQTAEGMVKDEKTLDRQQALLDSVLPPLVQQAEKLAAEEADFQAAADELANCDQEELSEARQSLIGVDADVDAKKALIIELRKQLEGKEAEIVAGLARKEQCIEDIRESERVREECRGWSSTEISALKGRFLFHPPLSLHSTYMSTAKVDALEKEHGWTITGVSGTTTSMTYKKEIELVFDAASFASPNNSSSHAKTSRIDLWYIAANRELNPLPSTAEKEFFLQNIRDHIRGFPQAHTPIKDLLAAVSSAWDKANFVQENIRLLNTSCPTNITKVADNSILVTSTLLIAPLTTKVEISFKLECNSSEEGISIGYEPSARVVYGERFNEPKMKEFLGTRCGSVVTEREKKAGWGAAVAELGEKLLARGRK